MKYNIKNKDSLQTMSNLLGRMKDSLVQQQGLVTELECELETILNQNRRNKTTILGESSGKVVTGVRQFADYIHKSTATAQKILNKKVLQENCIAYRVGNSWTINVERLNQLIAEDPDLLRC
jgi:hypothetical protein